MARGTAPQRKSKTTAVFEQDSDGSDAGSLQLESGSELGSDVDGSDEDLEEERSEEEEEERPKYAQFMDDSDLEEDSDDDSQDNNDTDDHEDATNAAYSSDDESDDDEQDGLQQQMKQIPFSALMKARQQMADSNDEEQDFSEPDISDLEEDEFAQDRQRLAQAKAGKQPLRNGHSKLSSSAADEALEQKRREVRERLRQLRGAPSASSSAADDVWAESRQQREQREQRRKESNQRKELVKRANKNAPTEVSSKRPVSRRRNVIETASSQARDPRFESLSGSVNKDLFAKSYSFLPEMFKDELNTLKRTLAKLKKQESTQAGPKAKSEQALAIRDERAKVEAALRRAEGLAGERERRARESAVKGKIKAQNKERVEKGLQPFYPKKSEVKQMLLKDKYERLAGGGEEGGKRVKGEEKKQLKKALERRRKKNAQKEKRDMPAGIGFGGGGVPKRKREGAAGGESGEASEILVGLTNLGLSVSL